jgi:hypothetical protein
VFVFAMAAFARFASIKETELNATLVKLARSEQGPELSALLRSHRVNPIVGDRVSTHDPWQGNCRAEANGWLQLWSGEF